MNHCLSVIVAAVLLASHAPAQSIEKFVSGLRKPVDFAADPTQDDRFYVVEQVGAIRIIEGGKLLDEPFFSSDPSNFTDKNWEQGLLGIALDPKFADNKRVYLNYSAKDGSTHISRFIAQSPHKLDPASEMVILVVKQPFGNHNGGSLRFGPDGMLYIGLGDGGAADDPLNAGQRLDTMLGKMLRIDVTSEPEEGKSYVIPKDNPFIGREGVLPEIWSYGLRNPWRYEFDSLGRLWIADVGQNRYEEIHLQKEGSKGGENYGWKIMEGFGVFRRGGQRSQDPPRLSPEQHAERGLEAPIWAYRHDPDGSITGGYFYEGQKIPSFKDRYFFAEFQRGRFWSLRLRDGAAFDVAEHTDLLNPVLEGQSPLQRISSFGKDNHGELYLLDIRAGAIYRLVP
ncbi:MAG: PQQ-dependent sugar dehydrogenase [Phycisphaeraceae bacterium]|nr:PQQ-dependent sugar dehydrogenase [Phycisphaeraceae bacterium]MCW5763565.1 PQQ-dependent sugar dehydrogenase [Phycisphaeraceae bacterium]